MDTLTVGLLSCGGMGNALADQCHGLDTARITAVCDVDEVRAKETGEKFGAAVYTDYQALLSEADVDAVIVASPGFLHRPMVEYAAASKKHIFCEKPLALTVADCDAMINAAKANGVKLMVGQVLRYIATFSWLRERVGSGEFGKVIGISTERIGGAWGGDYLTSWRLRRVESGGNLMEINAHELDFMRCIAGDATRVYAIGGNYIDKRQDYEDLVFASISFKNGAIGWLHSSSACQAGLGAYALRIQCDGGTFFVDGAFSGGVIRCGKAGGEVKEQPVSEIEVENPVRREVRLFVEAVLNHTEVEIPGSEGRAAVELAEAAYRSIATGQPVTLPL